MLDKVSSYFRLEQNNTDLRTEVIGGLTTFMTMAYIIFVNPKILADAGMDFGSVMVATCLAAGLGTAVMALLARYPIALAPGMGLNAFFAYEIVTGSGVKWETALGMVFISGVLFLALTFLKVREMLINAVPDSLKHAISAGIGLFIAFIGLQHAGMVADDPATLVKMGDLTAAPTLIALLGLAATLAMMVAGVKGAILWGIVISGVLGLLTGRIAPQGEGLAAVISLKPSLEATAFKLDILGVFKSWKLVALCLAFLFFDLFDTIGTLIGVSARAGFLKDGKLPRATQALTADALGTISGSLMGTSTTTSYIESATGIAAGARTGLASLVTAALFLVAILFSPLVSMFAQEFVTAPALIVVGFLMMGSVARISWKDTAEALPAFLTITLMPLTFSISRGLVAGFISWPLMQLAAGRGRQVHAFMWVLAGLLLAAVVMSYIFI